MFLHFDTYFKTYLSCRNDLTLSDNLEDELPLPKHVILQILRVMQIILENCPNKSAFDGLEVNCTEVMSFSKSSHIWFSFSPSLYFSQVIHSFI